MAADNQRVPSAGGARGPTVPGAGTGPLRAGGSFTRLQMVDDEQRFSDELPAYMQHKWGLSDVGFDYNMVAVFGSQSTGKSTLLNRLFGTRFDVMDEGNRQQTTRGIWADRGTDAMPVLILDVEGTDGRERGENQDFERKSALFSLAIAEVLIVNMWETMVGLYNGANMGLLKTVMEVNLQLFGADREGRTLLYFVIRDHVSTTTLESLAATLRKDMERIWDGLSKPAGMEDTRLSDFFDLKFTSLPHKLLQPEKFEQAALTLRKQFTDKAAAGYVFRPGYKRGVPADGFPHYAQAVWEKVVSNKDLDLPTQQELLAQYRCDEIAAAALAPFRAAIEPLRPRVREGEIVRELGEVARGAREQALGGFDEQAARYHADVYKKKRAAFVQTLDGELHSLALNQVKNAQSQAADRFASESHRALEDAAAKASAEGAVSAEHSFSVVVGGVRRRMTEWFGGIVKSLAIEGAGWSLESEVKQLESMLDATTAKLRVAEMERTLAQLRRNAQDALGEVIADRMGSPGDGMWAGVMAGFDEAVEQAEAQLRQRMELAEVGGAEQRQQLVCKLRRSVWEAMVESLREEVADQMVLLKLRGALEDRFRYDENGLPRVWLPSDDIDAQFAQARTAAQALLPLLSRIETSASRVLPDPSAAGAGSFFPAGFSAERSLTLIPAGRARELAKRFGREADALYLEAKRAMVTTQNHVPAWVLVLLLVLGWNEAMTILFNPLYLVLTALVGGTAVVLYQLRLWGPALRAINGLLSAANDHVHELLVEAVNRTEPAQGGAVSRPSRRSARHGHAKGVATDEIELEPLGDGSLSSPAGDATSADTSADADRLSGGGSSSSSSARLRHGADTP
ncbi:Dynamin-like GTPase that mediates homotypic ER fusion [Coemansia biformis]|uniref:Dynamin-like GTPase that mediates homotypic ER fusion n=1 Tax=Coemansia biformis TaxID=1286918 RepID=A0A9W7Y903_9FUNG|nr:Dynamin-like GTPase that mediates homotypic ER fusion [Coemansia biformis]